VAFDRCLGVWIITSSSSSSSSSSSEDPEPRLVNEEEEDDPLPPDRSPRVVGRARDRVSRQVDEEAPPEVIVLRVYTWKSSTLSYVNRLLLDNVREVL